MNKQEANKFKIDVESFSNTQFFNFVCESFQYTLYNISVIVPHSKSGVVPMSSLLGVGQLGFWEVGKGGTIG